MTDRHGWDSGGFRSPWVGFSHLGGRGWVNRCCNYYSHIFQPKISCFWPWVVVSWSFLSLWFGGYVNFVEIFGFLGGCLLVFSWFVVSLWFGGFAGFGGLQWQWICDCLLQWVEIVGLSCGWRLLAFVSWWWLIAMGLMGREEKKEVWCLYYNII